MTSKFSLYSEAYLKSLKKRKKEIQQKREEQSTLYKIVFYGVKTLINKPAPLNYGEAMTEFQLFSALKYMIALLTPNEFMNIFPVTKVYDGDRYEVKDYFYTMDYINSLEKDEPIGEKALEFLMEYTNPTIEEFTVKNVLCLSAIRRYEGHLSLVEEFLAADGHDTPNTFKNNKGEAMYVRHGKPTLVEKIKTNKLELVK